MVSSSPLRAALRSNGVKPSDEVRFWGGVDRSGGPTACWPWTRSIKRGGYGQFSTSRNGSRRSVSAHRFAWLATRGEIPGGLCVLHQCDHPPCCNPEHLFLGTKVDNNRDRHTKGRDASGARAGSVTHIDRMRRGETHPRTKLSDVDVAEMRRLYKTGDWTQHALAERFGVRDTHVSNIVRGASRGVIGCASTVRPIQHPVLYARGEKHCMAKLSWASVRAIRAAAAAGESRQSLAARYGVSYGAIRFIVLGKTWKEAASA
jgi:HNH endonuclease